ncbi:MAG: aryl-sulfate sulfotransferase [Anaerolineaceae bacterium]|nr:aryl-sulfate sulfotransferase [Anaerolineaceae bacterium]
MKKLISYIVFLILFISSACSIFSMDAQIAPEEDRQEEVAESIFEENNDEVENTPEIIVAEAGSETTIKQAVYLFAPIRSTTTYLIDSDGDAVFTWESQYTPGNSVYLKENGNLLHTGMFKSDVFTAGGAGGIVEEIAPDGTIVWSYQYASDQVLQHHDIEELPNGNILLIAWEMKSQAEAIEAGRSPDLLKDGELWADHVVEIDPRTNNIVWEWHIWDHLVQDYDATKENYGIIAEQPQRIDLNFASRQANADWTHINSIDYNAELDQILLSVHNFSEIWIIDHSRNTQEAAGDAGDLLYRWGNPQAYDAATNAEQQFYAQHDAQWIPVGYPGAGNILVFNNGDQRKRPYSSVDEIVPPLDTDETYTFIDDTFAPASPSWSYSGDNFFADHISGAQRLGNGNTLICNGTEGVFFEVTPDEKVIWRFNYGDEVFRVIRYEADYAGLSEFISSYSSMENITGTGQQAPQGQAQRPQLDFATAAGKLGVTEQALRAALGAPPPDFATAAEKLGVTEQALRDALDIPLGSQP